jgi:hypothetical protein
MSFLNDVELASLRIHPFIFHGIHHGEDEPLLFDETPIGEFEEFFLGRVRETLKGNKFQFLDGSTTCEWLQEIKDDPAKFVASSKRLASSFHHQGRGNIKPGVLMVILLRAGDATFFSLIKYDHDQVLAYEQGADRRAVLKEIRTSFTKSKKALHKSALIRLDGAAGDVIVIDRTIRHEITDFFKNFLQVRRTLTPKQMTEAVYKVALDTMKAHRETLPESVTSRITSLAFETIQQTETFEQDSFFEKTFGVSGTEEVKKTFDGMLRKHNIDGESFQFEKKAVKPPRKRRFKTSEGVKIEYESDATDTVSIEYPKEHGDLTTVTIKTRKLSET